MIIKHCDMVALKFCNRGARAFFDRHGINWSSFVQHGIDSKQLEHIDDAMMQEVIAKARAREQREKGDN